MKKIKNSDIDAFLWLILFIIVGFVFFIKNYANQIVLFLLYAFIVVISCIILYLLFRIILKKHIIKELELNNDFAQNIRVHLNFKKSLVNTFILNIPLKPKEERTLTNVEEDLNKEFNDIDSYIYYKFYEIIIRGTYRAYEFANYLRLKGIEIKRCDFEDRKRERIIDQRKMAVSIRNIDSVLANFESKPTDFEIYCKDIYISMGYDAKTTPPTNDGGYDIFYRKDGVTGIVECKCYNYHDSIGRPLIQKLVGANAIAKADEMVFITTSYFTKAAIEYANKLKVQLIDGNKLNTIIDEYNKQFYDENVSMEDWKLTKKDISRLINSVY